MSSRAIIVCLITLLMGLSSTGVLAQSPEPDSSPSGAVQENLRERIKKAAENQQVQGASTTGVKRGFIGTVKRISEETMTLETTRGTLVVTLSDVVLVQNNKAISTDDIEIDNSAVIMGFQSGEDFEPRRIIITENSLRPTAREIHIGSVQKIDRTSITLTPRGTTDTKVFAFLPSNRTRLLNRLQDTISTTSIESGEDVILITTAEDPNTQAVKDSAGRIKILYSLAQDPASQ